MKFGGSVNIILVENNLIIFFEKRNLYLLDLEIVVRYM